MGLLGIGSHAMFSPRPRTTAKGPDHLVVHLVEVDAVRLEVDAVRLEDAGGDPPTLADERDQEVLGADAVVAEPLRLVLGQRQDLACAGWLLHQR
jgi:hypothetical protein